MKVNPFVYIAPLVILALALAVGSKLLLVVFVALMTTEIASLFWALTGTLGIEVTGKPLPLTTHVGDSIPRELTISNSGRAPRFLVGVEEESDIPGYHNTALLNVSGGSSQTLQNTVTPPIRGQFTLGRVTLRSQDPFGLFRRTVRTGATSRITVYPRVIDLPLFHTSFSSLVDIGHGSASRRISQISPSASSIREMVSGDSQEHIHWRSTAHAGKLMVKVFDAEHSGDTSKNVWILVDMEARAHAGQGAESTEEYSATVAASLAKKYLDDGMRVGIVAKGEKNYRIPPGDGRQHFTKLIEALTFVRAKGTSPIDELVKDLEQPGDSSSVVLVTPNPAESLTNGLRLLRAYSHQVTAVLLDSSTFGGTSDAASHAAQSLGAMGAQVYVVRKGDNIARALDSRGAIWYSRYV